VSAEWAAWGFLHNLLPDHVSRPRFSSVSPRTAFFLLRKSVVMADFEIRSSFEPPALESKRSAGGRLPVIVGYASVFNSLSSPIPDGRGSSFREIVRPGAFLRSLADVSQRKADVIARFNHEGIFGRAGNGTLRLREDSHGLRYEIDPPDTQAGRDLVELIRRGDVHGSSFAFRAIKDNWRSDKVGRLRELTDVQILDVCPTPTPAYPAATTNLYSTGPTGAMAMQLKLAEAVV
jgi:HK97 family phage prohead protease